ncbi:serine carboxypeptidase [Echria macrotheca]|uniref:Serine carboxypeptidase n=1 Tax=Echria macrotheca TaxID=438768 RepID=A0AAJ0BQ33_9PEZI|nr:serine carboxypeptidase [Echria macrotheca]
MLFLSFGVACLWAGAAAQFPPPPEGVTVLKSKFHENVTISFKEPHICETTPGVKSYSGYVHLPPGFLDGESQDYPINTFFWFFEARKNPHTAPLSIWLNGGPGGSSIMGLLEENGPCFVGPDSKTTVLNPWSWNNEVNMLYIDQPNQVGFSYDIATNCTFDASGFGLGFVPSPADFSDGVPESNLTFRVGTAGSNKLSATANSTAHAAHALWHFAQTWFFEFPHYKPADNRISLWTESYGGHYGPGFMGFWQEQNEKIERGESREQGAHKLHLDTLGIINGLMDLAVQGEAYIEFGYNNTYDIPIWNETLYEAFMYNWTRPGGCRDRILACQAASRNPSPKTNLTEICGGIDGDGCDTLITLLTQEIDAGFYDIAHPAADPFPPPHLHGFLAEASSLAALGVPVNYTAASLAVGVAFDATYDIIIGGFLEKIAHLLESGVKVHLVYGDRDWACNWMGGEAASLAVPWTRQREFAGAGYAQMITQEGRNEGLTRQVGNFSFTRVFQAGHEVPSYQPVAAYDIFMRSLGGWDIATGTKKVDEGLVTEGMKDTRAVRHAPPKRPDPKCYVLKPMSCTAEVWETVANGTAVVKDYYVVGVKGDHVREDL